MRSDKAESKLSAVSVVAIWTFGSIIIFTLGSMVAVSNAKYISYLFGGFLLWTLISAALMAFHMYDELAKERRAKPHL